MEYEIIETPEAQTTELSMGNDQLLQMAEQAERRVAAVNTIMKAALGVTTHLDWVNIGGKPYLQETGASKIARLMGVSMIVRDYKKVYDDDKSGHYAYHYDMRMSFAGAEIDATGLRSTRDDFFIGSPNATMKNEKGETVLKPQKKPQDVDERDVKLSAYTNCLNNGIKRIVPGLRNITVETLKEGGIEVDKIKGYNFNNNQPASMSNVALDQKAEIERMLKEVYGDDLWTKGLEIVTSFTGRDGNVVPGKTDINKISEKQMSVTYGNVKKNYEAWVNGGKQPLTPQGD